MKTLRIISILAPCLGAACATDKSSSGSRRSAEMPSMTEEEHAKMKHR